MQTQYKVLEEKINTRINKVLDRGDYVLGNDVVELEKKLATCTGVKHCLSCASGTDALLLPLMAKKIGRGDAVFTTSFSFIATAEVISLVGARPIFVDVDKKTFNIDPVDLEDKINKTIKEGIYNPRCIIPVNIFGSLADYQQISKISSKYNLFVIEDGAQSFGATFQNHKSCSFGDVGATSFYPAKPLGCYGDGGAVFTNDDHLYSIMKSIRVHGEGIDKYHNDRIGLNSRLDTLQASILIEKLKIFDEELKKRNEIATLYSALLKDSFSLQYVSRGSVSSWAQFSLLAENNNKRQLILDKLNSKNIPAVIYYSIPLHLQLAFKNLGYKIGDLPNSEDISKRIFSIPMHPYLSNSEINKIAEVLIDG